MLVTKTNGWENLRGLQIIEPAPIPGTVRVEIETPVVESEPPKKRKAVAKKVLVFITFNHSELSQN